MPNWGGQGVGGSNVRELLRRVLVLKILLGRDGRQFMAFQLKFAGAGQLANNTRTTLILQVSTESDLFNTAELEALAKESAGHLVFVPVVRSTQRGEGGGGIPACSLMNGCANRFRNPPARGRGCGVG